MSNWTICEWCGSEFDTDLEGEVIDGADVCGECVEEEELMAA